MTRLPGDRAAREALEDGARYLASRAISDWNPAETYQPGDVVRMPDGTLATLEPVPGEPETPPAWKPLRRVTVRG